MPGGDIGGGMPRQERRGTGVSWQAMFVTLRPSDTACDMWSQQRR